MLVRSGKVAFWQAEVEWGLEGVHPFPGVQISIQLPRALFGRACPANLRGAGQALQYTRSVSRSMC